MTADEITRIRAEALEEAAKLAEQLGEEWWNMQGELTASHLKGLAKRIRALIPPPPKEPTADEIEAINRVPRHKIGDRVHKKSGSSWHGRVVGFYSTTLTPIGYCVESERETGSVQIYPEAALEKNDD
jgi:hypothetical protein